jgi:hypothetical protein
MNELTFMAGQRITEMETSLMSLSLTLETFHIPFENVYAIDEPILPPPI